MEKAIRYDETLVGYFDIYGYSSFVKSPLDECLSKIDKLIAKVQQDGKAQILDWRLKHWLLSDSIIITPDLDSHPLDEYSIDFFIGICSVLLHRGISTGFPLRGAIGGGYIYKSDEVLLSSALVDAHDYEQVQKWWGAVITPSALRIIHKYVPASAFGQPEGSPNAYPNIRKGIVPWKEDKALDIKKQEAYYYIVPPQRADTNTDWTTYLPDYLDLDKAQAMIKNSRCLYGHSSYSRDFADGRAESP